MTMSTIGTSVTGAYTQASSDISGTDCLVEKDVIFWSTNGDTPIYLTARNHEVVAHGAVIGSCDVIQLGWDNKQVGGQALHIGATGSVLGGDRGAVIWRPATIVNKGASLGSDSALELWLDASDPTTLTNSDVIANGDWDRRRRRLQGPCGGEPPRRRRRARQAQRGTGDETSYSRPCRRAATASSTFTGMGNDAQIEIGVTGFFGSDLMVGEPELVDHSFRHRAGSNAAQDANDRFVFRDDDTLWFDRDGWEAPTAPGSCPTCRTAWWSRLGDTWLG